MNSNWKNREDVFNFLDEYSTDIKEQIDAGKTKHTLLKSYIFETYNSHVQTQGITSNNVTVDLPRVLEFKNFKVTQVDEQLFYVGHNNEAFGFVEQMNDRFSVFYSIGKASTTDSYANNVVKQSVQIDSMWISGIMFDAFWQHINQFHAPHRFIKMKFEFDGFFDDLQYHKAGLDDSDDSNIYDDRRVTSITMTKALHEIWDKISGVRELFPEFYSVGLLRFPSMTGRGGHDFYRNGKVTNRSDDFRDHRYQILNTVNTYRRITEHLESIMWLDFEVFRAPETEYSFSLHGSPITFKFEKPLSPGIFRNFVDYTFPRGKEPFKILGQPIWVGEHRVHIYGTDLHLWQRLMMELTPQQFTVILPTGTCGNTLHRLVTNVQRYLDPGVSVSVGNVRYDDIVRSHVEMGYEGE